MHSLFFWLSVYLHNRIDHTYIYLGLYLKSANAVNVLLLSSEVISSIIIPTVLLYRAA